ncbi:MAG: EAL domain-containing protein [Campylobacterota bacterium]
MTYTEQKERSHRFVLALRIGLPVFLLVALTLFTLLSKWTETMFESFVLMSITMLVFIVYFILYLIYQSSRENITDPLTHTFTADYFFKFFDRNVQKGVSTLMMISVENLWYINERYGIKNGDAALVDVVGKVNRFFAEKGLEKLPVCRYRGGVFLLLFPGEKEDHIPLLELFLSKYQNFVRNDIEIRLEAVMADTRLTRDAELLVSRLYELHNERTKIEKEEDYPINELEKEVAGALEEKRFSIGFWPILSEEGEMYDTAVKLVDSKGKLIHQSRYVPILNRLNLMRRFESEILEEIGSVCTGPDKRFVISVSPATLRNPHFFEHALTLLERRPAARNAIVLMFEEKEYFHQMERFSQQIAHYRKAGYKIGLDRLGGYHTTMLYLKELDVDVARFDPLYSRHIREEKHQNLLQGLNLGAHLCGVKTWISMIEDEESDRIARSLKINYRQGNYLGKILTTKDIQG